MNEYRTERGVFYNGDCMAGMATYPDKHFDIAIVDPPYGINRDSDGTIVIKNDAWKNAMVTNNIKSKQWDCIPENSYFQEIIRVSKMQIIWGGNYFDLPRTNSWIIWDKKVTNKMFSKFEMAWKSEGRPDIFYFMYEGYKREAGVEKQERIHPTQKPVELYKWLVKNYVKQGQRILDTHVGSASSLIAYEDAGLEYVGYELDADYYKAAVQRIKDHKAQLTMFPAGIS